jgi:hypothetical protein
MPLQLFAQLLARCSALIAFSGSLMFLCFLLFQVGSSPKATRFLGKVAEAGDSLDEGFNSTLGVSSFSLLHHQAAL